MCEFVRHASLISAENYIIFPTWSRGKSNTLANPSTAVWICRFDQIRNFFSSIPRQNRVFVLILGLSTMIRTVRDDVLEYWNGISVGNEKNSFDFFFFLMWKPWNINRSYHNVQFQIISLCAVEPASFSLLSLGRYLHHPYFDDVITWGRPTRMLN